MKVEQYESLIKEEQFEYLISNLNLTNRTPEYYVNWKKVEDNSKLAEVQLNTLEYLIGKENIEEECEYIFNYQIDLVKVIPQLLAIRELKFTVLIEEELNLEYAYLDFKNPEKSKIPEYIDFMKKSGLLELLKTGIKKSLIDYSKGVEVGLDSNGRKNRSGKYMELIVEKNIKAICKKNNWKYINQATKSKIANVWGMDVPTDKINRIFDFAITNSKESKLVLIEVNYYGSQGSKLKAVSGEFTSLNQLYKENENITFFWITDGQGWLTARTALQDAFIEIEDIFNFNLIDNGILENRLLNFL